MIAPAKRRGLAAMTAACACLCVIASTAPAEPAGEGGSAVGTEEQSEFVDEARCASCHEAEHRAWRGSHHDLAMQEPDENTVLGDFSGSVFEHRGIETTFARRDGKFFVTTDGPDGEVARFEVAYVFGVAPLQQYLLRLPRGRLQALSVAWDTGAKRWFHLYPDEPIDHRDELHWTKPSQNWNFMCAECHSTDLDKGYDRAADRYDTRWARIDVGCQACHGPGAAHASWAEAHADTLARAPSADGDGPAEPDPGFAVAFGGASASAEVEACARCHARRSVIAPDYVHGERLMDTHLPALLDDDLYYADGQIRGEVYEYGSFLQSKMAAKGLRCSDCHDAHSGALKAEGDALCVSCHNDASPAARAGIDTSGLRKVRYDSVEHHFHEPGEPGSRCVDCHAPKTLYMVVDPRADHSFRVPRPDLSAATGAPDACTRCHTDKTAAWAAEVIGKRSTTVRAPHYGQALAAGRNGEAGAMRRLAALAADAKAPAIVRATALELLIRYPGASAFAAWSAGLGDPDPLVRHAALSAHEMLPPQVRTELLSAALADPVRAVRIEAARLLAATGEGSLPAQRHAAFRHALDELRASYRANEDRAEGRLGEADLLTLLGRGAEAERVYREALAFDPLPVPVVVNLADLMRARGDDGEAERVLRDGLAKRPGDPSLRYALALTLVRRGHKAEAIELLAAAAADEPRRTDIVYAYAVALADLGQRERAIGVLEKALDQSRGSRDVLLALAAFERDGGDVDAARDDLEKLRAINPDDPALRSR